MSNITASLKKDLGELYKAHGRQPLASDPEPEALPEGLRLYRVTVAVYVVAPDLAEAERLGIHGAGQEPRADSVIACGAYHNPPAPWGDCIPYGGRETEQTVDQILAAMRKAARQQAQAAELGKVIDRQQGKLFEAGQGASNESL